MNLLELHNTKLDLNWEGDDQVQRATFSLDDRRYRISAILEDVEGYTAAHIEFTVENDSGEFSHDATNLNAHAFKVLGIVVNGVVAHLGRLDAYYFIAKQRLGAEYERRCRIYGRMAHKLHVEHDLTYATVNYPGEKAFILARTDKVMVAIKTLLGDDLKEQL